MRIALPLDKKRRFEKRVFCTEAEKTCYENMARKVGKPFSVMVRDLLNREVTRNLTEGKAA
jgi:hypothetical protein